LHTSWDYGLYLIGEVAHYIQGDLQIDGNLTFGDNGRINWTKYTANSVTLTTGTSTSAVADLQTDNDGNVYHVTEAIGTPAIDLIIDFVSVTGFNWVKVLATYDGGATHAMEVELYNWVTASWDTFDSMQSGFSNSGAIFGNHSFFVPNQTDYIGTGGSLGQVRVRLDHPMTGNASHDLYVDEVAVYQ